MNVLYDFLPYTWYDISLYPSHTRLDYRTPAPRVSLLVKYYDAAKDEFLYYKAFDTSYHHTPGESSEWNTPPGHRPIGFMHDGMDLPRWKGESTGLDGAKSHPPLRSMSISREQRLIEKQEREALAGPWPVEEPADAEATQKKGEAGELAFAEGSAEPPVKPSASFRFYNAAGRLLWRWSHIDPAHFPRVGEVVAHDNITYRMVSIIGQINDDSYSVTVEEILEASS